MPFYDEIDQRIEKWCEIIYFVIIRLNASTIVMSKVLASAYHYICFLKDPCGNYELELPLPMW